MMGFENQGGDSSGLRSPGGFEFGVVGWMWNEPRPTSITFFLDGTAMVCDQHGRPIKGVEVNNERVWFAVTPPLGNRDSSLLYERRYCVVDGKKVMLATHAQVIAALIAERIDWLKLSRAGLPQLPYNELKNLPDLPLTSVEELRRIPDPTLRRDALRIRREVDEIRVKEMQAIEDG